MSSAIAWLALAAIACAGPSGPSNGLEAMPTVDPGQNGIVSQSDVMITRRPVSYTTLVVGVPYQYTYPACEATSPPDFDGSFWDLPPDIDSKTLADAKGRIVLMSPDTATFTRDDGAVTVLTRHAGDKTFPSCA